MRKSLRLLTGAAAIAGLAALAPAAHASVHHHAVSRTITIVFSDHGDGGSAGNFWAEDQGQAFLTVTSTGGNTYTASLSALEGSFATIPGQLAPNQSASPGLHVTASQVVGSSSTLAGSVDYSFTADHAPDVSGTVVLSGDNPRLSTWEQLAFPAGTVFGGPGITNYSFTYRLKCPSFNPNFHPVQTWTDSSSNGDGNLPGDGNIHGC